MEGSDLWWGAGAEGGFGGSVCCWGGSDLPGYVTELGVRPLLGSPEKISRTPFS